MGHAPGRTGGVVLERLHPGHRQFSVPERGGPGRKAQHIPLPNLGMPPRSRACRAIDHLGSRTRFPIRISDTPYRVDRMFAKLWRAISRPPCQERQRQAWISSKTWSLINTRIVVRRRKDQRSSQALIHAIKARLQEDRRRHAAKAGSTVDSLLASDPPLIQEAWIRMRGWYKAKV